MSHVRQAKRVARGLRKEAARERAIERRQQWWSQLRCFWTWPLGHEWADLTDHAEEGMDLEPARPRRRCVGCEKSPY